MLCWQIETICTGLRPSTMVYIILLSVLGVVLLMLIIMTHYFHALAKPKKQDSDITIYESGEENKKEKLEFSKGSVYAAMIGVIIAMLVCAYLIIKGTPWEGHMMEWLNLLIRLMHITFGIAWIGASFYFVFLENALNRTENVRNELAGNLWAIHGGGFYYLEKYKIAPKQIPRHLHWFKYEAYFTWLSGFCLLFVVYYFNARAFLIDTNVLNISPLAAVGIGIGSFIVGWIIYDLLCKTPLVKKGYWFTIIGSIILVGFAYFYTHVFNSRAAYIHFGAMLGTLMAGNVFFIIIPSQKAMVKAAKEGKAPDPGLGKHAGLRSMHNNYFTLPVLFVMVSNHFPTTFGNEYPWLILAVISLGTAGVKHWLNLKEKGQYSIWILPGSAIVLLAAVFMTAPAKPGECKKEISFAQVNAIINTRCISCHSGKPTDNIYTTPPNGVAYDTPQDIIKMKEKIMLRVVITKTMPQNNKTGITPEEREIIRCWIDQGASLK